MNRVALLVSLLALWFSANLIADQTDDRLDALFAQLQSGHSISENQDVEIEIWRIWQEHDDPDVAEAMRQGLEAMSDHLFDEALTHFEVAIDKAPAFAEAWNKKATILYLKDDLRASLVAIQHTLTLEPRHFGALSGMGRIMTRLGNDWAALEAYEAVLEINPMAEAARVHVQRLRKQLGAQAI